MTWKNSVTPAEVVDLLNDLMRRDFAAVRALFELRVSCNAELASHPTVQVKFEDAGGEAPIQFNVGLLGILNGLFGVDDQKRGVIRSVHDSMLGLQRFELAPADQCELTKPLPVLVAAPEVFGFDEGDRCGRDGCDGILELNLRGLNCSCHICPPCSQCENAGCRCPKCGWDRREEK